ncbi:hypothetical protein ECEC1862_2936, partial [Escherichia coli EC1862]
MNIPL